MQLQDHLALIAPPVIGAFWILMLRGLEAHKNYSASSRLAQ
jgi:hypothetical protein